MSIRVRGSADWRIAGALRTAARATVRLSTGTWRRVHRQVTRVADVSLAVSRQDPAQRTLYAARETRSRRSRTISTGRRQPAEELSSPAVTVPTSHSVERTTRLRPGLPLRDFASRMSKRARYAPEEIRAECAMGVGLAT